MKMRSSPELAIVVGGTRGLVRVKYAKDDALPRT